MEFNLAFKWLKEFFLHSTNFKLLCHTKEHWTNIRDSYKIYNFSYGWPIWSRPLAARKYSYATVRK